MPRRAEFSKETKRQALERSGGKCECCGVEIVGTPHYDHIVPSYISQDASLANCQVLSRRCHEAKTSGEDRPKIDKARRLEEKRLGLRTKRRGFPKPPAGYDPWTRSMRKED